MSGLRLVYRLLPTIYRLPHPNKLANGTFSGRKTAEDVSKGVKNEGDSHYIIENTGGSRETPTMLMKTN